jgi:pimeloyl-ACP methyl ester carboxylesterase
MKHVRDLRRPRPAHRRHPGRLVAAVTAIALVGATLGTPATAATAPATPCVDVSVPVTIAGQPGPVDGTLCTPPGARTLQLLISGFSYNRGYWDDPYEPATYSYVHRANAAGYATLAIDRIGTGTSWRPSSVLTTLDDNVGAVSQVVRAVRRGDLGASFAKLVLVGHSYGSLTAYGVAGADPSIDAVIATGASHAIDYPYAAVNLFPYLRPAALDAQFAERAPDIGYLVTAPGHHNVFVNAADTDPANLALNEGALKDIGTLEELATLVTHSVQNLLPIRSSAGINVPVLAINGADDPFFCGPPAADCRTGTTLANFERPFFGPHATVEGYVVPNTGHGLNIERTAPQTYTAMIDFLTRHGVAPR